MDNRQKQNVYDVPNGSLPRIYKALSPNNENSSYSEIPVGEYHYDIPENLKFTRQQNTCRSCFAKRNVLIGISFIVGAFIGVVITAICFSALDSSQNTDGSLFVRENLESPPGNKSFMTPERYHFQMIRCEIGNTAFDQKFVTFSVKACSDAYVLLTSKYYDSGPSTEIAIGTNGNMRAGIRREKLGRNIVTHIGSYVSCREYTQFWISWKSQFIAVGFGQNEYENQFMAMRDDRSLSVVNLGISTGWGTTGEWMFVKP